MREDSSLFKYELAIVSVLKNEAPYVKEWVDYHLLAGVEHFYLYDNESEDDLKTVLQPYVDRGVVDYIACPDKAAQMFVYNQAIQKYKFDCRYIAFIDGDEFIFPQNNKTILDVLHEELDNKPIAAGLAINWHMFGSSGQEKADLSKGVLERFKHRAEDKFNASDTLTNSLIKTIANPRCVDTIFNPHFCSYYLGVCAFDETGKIVPSYSNSGVPHNKIVINHYSIKSKEEFTKKVKRGNADHTFNTYKMETFDLLDKAATIYDDEILKYRDERQKNYTESKTDIKAINQRRFNRMYNTLSPLSLFVNSSRDLLRRAPANFFKNRLSDFLICWAIARDLKSSLLSEADSKHFEEVALKCAHASFLFGTVTGWKVQLLVSELPKILKLEYPIVEDIKEACLKVIPQILNAQRMKNRWTDYVKLDYVLQMLKK